MTRFTAVYSIVLVTVVLTSCKKDKDDPTPQSEPSPVYGDYSNLKPGNYWVYQTFEIDQSGVETPKPVYDSCYIENDTLINGQTYFKMVRPSDYLNFTIVDYLRDSLHYVVNSSGKRLFSSDDFMNVLATRAELGNGDTLYTVNYYMTDKDSIISTEAGSSATYNYEGMYHNYPPLNTVAEYRPKEMRYAKDVGIVEENMGFYASSPLHFTRRLVRYHVE